MSAAARIAAGLGASAGAFGLALQYGLLHDSLTADGATPLEAAWRYFAYFTILTNVFVTIVMARAAFGARNGSRLELMAVTSILFVCVVYNLLLASRWDPQGWQKVADVLLHNVTPLAAAGYWLLGRQGQLRFADALIAALWPLAYAAYGLTRGAFDGFYPYFFMDPTATSYERIALNLAGLVVAFVLGAVLLISVSRWLARRQP